MAIRPICPGFVYQFSHTYSIANGWINLYKLGWLFSVFVGGTAYIFLSCVFKDAAMTESQRHPWESYAKNQIELLDKEPAESTVILTNGSAPGDVGYEKNSEVLDENYTDRVGSIGIPWGCGLKYFTALIELK